MNAPVRIRRDPRDLALSTAADRHKGALIAILYGLTELRDGDLAELVDGAADVLRHRLGRDERGAMLMIAAQAAEPSDLTALAWAIADDSRAGAPIPPLDGIRAEAKLWASEASPAERRAYVAACWNAMPERDRSAFLREARRAVR